MCDCTHVCTRNRTYVHALDREQYSQTHAKQINARKLTAAIDAWAISACKRNRVLRIRSKTFRMYCRYNGMRVRNLCLFF